MKKRTLDPYEAFIASRVAAGESPVGIVDRLLLLNDAPPCKFCGGLATKLCDYRVARCRETAEELICSLPICIACASGGDLTFFCGAEGGVDTTDYCPDHKHGYFGHAPDVIVPRLKLYSMEKAGRGSILVKSDIPMLSAV